MKFCGNRNGLDEDGNDIRWPELKHDGEEAVMQPLPARRTGGAGFDMSGEEGESDVGHRGGAEGYGAGDDAGSLAGGYGAKMVENDSTAHLTGAGAFGGHGGGGADGGYPPSYYGGADGYSNYGYQDQQQHHGGGYDAAMYDGQQQHYDAAAYSGAQGYHR